MILTRINQSVTTASAESMGDFFACSISALKISRVIGLRCLAMHSSFSLAKIILVHIFVLSDSLAGGSIFFYFEQYFDGFNISSDCGRSGVVIKHELLHETCNDPLVSRLAAARILNAMLFCKV